jgi:glycolate oxidase
MISQNIYQSFKAMVGPGRVSQAPEDLVVASYDASKNLARPEMVVKPLTATEVSRIIRLAYENNIPVYPRGAASGMTGGTLALKGGIALDTSLMNRILEINPEDMIAMVEPGVVVADFQKQVETHGLFYPPDPASAEFSTMGGNVAECAGGVRCIKYGVTRDYVLGLEVVLPNGEIIHTGSHTLKSVTGYDLTRLLVGSEGTLGVFTRITVRLVPLPEKVETLVAFFTNLHEVWQFSRWLAQERIWPRALEVMDETCLRAIRNYQPEFEITPSARTMLLIEVDGGQAETTLLGQKIHTQLEAMGALQTIRANDAAQASRCLRIRDAPYHNIGAQYLWSIRKAISPALYSIAPKKISEDICVPRSKILKILEIIKELESKYLIPVAIFGHLGDGNLHVHFLIFTPRQETNLDGALEALFRETVRLGGTLSGEHGIGITKSKYLPLEVRAGELKLMQQLKTLLDPKGIMNPGKICPE